MKRKDRVNPYSIAGRLSSLGHAFRGIRALVTTQPNVLLHLTITVAVVTLGVFFGLSYFEWAIIALCIASVLCAEALNTALEFLADAVEPEINALVGRAKDVAAGAVLLMSIGAGMAGLLILAPHAVRALGG